MLMANSVEGRFPFLDLDVARLADSLPASYKLRVLDEKYVLKRAAGATLPPAILARKKQPYRAPEAAAFLGGAAPPWVGELLSRPAVAAAGIFDPGAIGQLYEKCRSRDPGTPLSNSDSMALVGALSAQLLHRLMVQGGAGAWPVVAVVDRTPGDATLPHEGPTEAMPGEGAHAC
jgi:asparagine synthase (glutamine-hydrolysing)